MEMCDSPEARQFLDRIGYKKSGQFNLLINTKGAAIVTSKNHLSAAVSTDNVRNWPETRQLLGGAALEVDELYLEFN